MMLFDIIVPVAALAVAGVIVAIVRITDNPGHGKQHPAE